MWHLIFSIVSFYWITNDHECLCKYETVTLREIKREFKLEIHRQDHGFVQDLFFDSIGVLSITCLYETILPTMNLEKDKADKIDTINRQRKYYGTLGNHPDYIWREDVLRGHLSIKYVVKDDYKEEFDLILNSVIIDEVPNEYRKSKNKGLKN